MPRTKRHLRDNFRAVLAAGAVTVVCLAVALAAAMTSAGQSATAKAVQAVVHDALEAEHTLATLPASAADQGVSAAMRGQMIAAAQSVINKLYVGPIKDARTETIIGGLQVEGTSDGIYVWDGGVHDVVFRSTSIEGTSATVVAQATTYLVVSTTRDGERTRVESTGINTFKLVLQGGQWFVTDEEIEYLPGEGP